MTDNSSNHSLPRKLNVKMGKFEFSAMLTILSKAGKTHDLTFNLKTTDSISLIMSLFIRVEGRSNNSYGVCGKV